MIRVAQVRRLFFSLLCVFALGCGLRDESAQRVLRKYGLMTEPEPAHFEICTQFGCRGFTPARLDAFAWSRVAAIFLPRADNAVEERECIARSVALLERLVGEQTGTGVDVARNREAGAGQLDCVAESVNTSVYLLMLQERGFLAYHRVDAPQRRGMFIFNPHNTAVIREIATDERYAVDSWFGNNGEPPYLVPLRAWLRGWRPGEENGTVRDSALPASSELEHGL